MFNFFRKGPSISPSKLIEIKDQVALLDVRDPEEVNPKERDFFKNYQLIPLVLLSQYIDRLDPKETYYILCHSGARSLRASGILTRHNIRNIVIDHGIMGLEEYIYS